MIDLPGSLWLYLVGALIFTATGIWYFKGGLSGLGKEQHPLWRWRQYFNYQGSILFIFFVLGGTLGLVSYYVGPSKGKARNGVQYAEYRQLKVSDDTVLTPYLDVKDHSRFTIIGRVISPDNGAIAVSIWGIRQNNISEIRRIDLSNQWSSWEQKNLFSQIRLGLEKTEKPGAQAATEVDILIYSSP